MCQVSIARPPLRAPALTASSTAASSVFTLTSNGMNS